jgi:hypothetical protein
VIHGWCSPKVAVSRSKEVKPIAVRAPHAVRARRSS